MSYFIVLLKYSSGNLGRCKSHRRAVLACEYGNRDVPILIVSCLHTSKMQFILNYSHMCLDFDKRILWVVIRISASS